MNNAKHLLNLTRALMKPDYSMECLRRMDCLHSVTINEYSISRYLLLTPTQSIMRTDITCIGNASLAELRIKAKLM